MKVKVINLDGIKRIVFGELIDELDVDYKQDLKKLKEDLDLALETWIELNQTKPLGFLKTGFKKIKIHQGSNHLEIVNDGVGTLGWLMVQDN
ncbi:hypothetical protein AMD27_17660 (plasmid) [Acinetobacter sp. TGL-Y2]|uniref:hypothetical protein n=1 Tax=Acinetobacter sp. TGL-Y2 TaxID=1407071 RepID=UPI0007A66C0C|nr:hypothetical protein [Acinetobacter sp. TGL-Y2]AMW80743.1 hypothetical protein AMD27_17660 [Acinetobacter sp. TGL-Y2]